MSTIVVHCPHCGTSRTTTADGKDKTRRCSGCQKDFLIRGSQTEEDPFDFKEDEVILTPISRRPQNRGARTNQFPWILAVLIAAGFLLIIAIGAGIWWYHTSEVDEEKLRHILQGMARLAEIVQEAKNDKVRLMRQNPHRLEVIDAEQKISRRELDLIQFQRDVVEDIEAILRRHPTWRIDPPDSCRRTIKNIGFSPWMGYQGFQGAFCGCPGLFCCCLCCNTFAVET